MTGRARVGAVGTMVVAAGLLSGCAGLVERSYPGGIPGITPTPISSATPGVQAPPLDLGPTAGWVDGGRRLAVTLGGSSSCPVKPKSLTVYAEDRLTVETKRTAGWFFGACTADLQFTTYELRVPDSLSPTRPIHVTIDETERIIPPRNDAR